MPIDHYVNFRSDETIADIAASYRSAAKASRPYFNIVDYINALIEKRAATRDAIALNIYQRDYPDPDSHASVTFSPLTLHVAEDIWINARNDDPFCRFVLAHELGHIALHRNDELGFSSDPTTRISFAEKGHSAEAQADTFALHFFMPDSLVEKLTNAEVLEAACLVPLRWINERLHLFKSKKPVLRKSYTGDCCKNCGNFTMIGSATGLKCDTCKAAIAFSTATKPSV